MPSGLHPGPPSHSLGLLRGASWGRCRPGAVSGVLGPLLHSPGAAATLSSVCLQGRVCGLCGNFDDNALNDFTTRSQSVVSDVLEFGNSWKFSPSCPDALAPGDPCTTNPHRKSWAQKQCSIINSATFSACHAHVRGAPPGTWGGRDGGSPPPSGASGGRAGPCAPGETGPGRCQTAWVPGSLLASEASLPQVEQSRYYKACVSDACACNSGGDCECFCTAVAAYAQACHDAGVCVSWRTPDICRELGCPWW